MRDLSISLLENILIIPKKYRGPDNNCAENTIEKVFIKIIRKEKISRQDIVKLKIILSCLMMRYKEKEKHEKIQGKGRKKKSSQGVVVTDPRA